MELTETGGVDYGIELTRKADNDDWLLMERGSTPAEFWQWLCRTRNAMKRELAADFTLRSCPKHRKIWNELHAMEACFRWQYGDKWG